MSSITTATATPVTQPISEGKPESKKEENEIVEVAAAALKNVKDVTINATSKEGKKRRVKKHKTPELPPENASIVVSPVADEKKSENASIVVSPVADEKKPEKVEEKSDKAPALPPSKWYQKFLCCK